MRYEGLKKKSMGVCFEIINEPGGGFLESMYPEALVLASRQAQMAFKRLHSRRPFPVHPVHPVRSPMHHPSFLECYYKHA